MISDEVTIAPLAVIGDRVRIGKRVTICAGTVVGDDVVIGGFGKDLVNYVPVNSVASDPVTVLGCRRDQRRVRTRSGSFQALTGWSPR